MMRVRENLIGRTFGHWTVLSQAEDYITPSSGQHRRRWVCQCDCDNKTIQNILEDSLLKGKSCQCKECANKIIGEKNKKHNGSRTRLYQIWRDMKKRCYNSNDKEFHNYGGRGISICEQWRNSYAYFMEWALKNGYTDDLTIERIDVNQNYCPENCIWASQKVQQNNKRTNHLLTYNNETHTIAEWSDITGLNFAVIYARIKYGWSVEQTLTTPIKGKLKSKEEI